MKFLCLILALTCNVQGAKILGIFQVPAFSHNKIGSRLMLELAARGHDVTFISPHPQKAPVQNLRDVVLTDAYEELNKVREETNMFEMGDNLPFLMMFFVGQFGTKLTELALGHENVQRLLKSNETFDVVIKEQFMDDALQGFAHHFRAPLVVLSTLGPTIWTNRLVGNSAPPSYVVDLFLNYSPKMTFLQRTCNTIVTVLQELFAHLYLLPLHDKILHKYFPTAPHIYDLLYNTSLVLLNSHTSIDPSVPFVPNMIDIGGFHVESPKKLPESLEEFLDSAQEGVIYFSMGSNLRSKDLPPQKRDDILKVFSALKMKVLWKWEDDKLQGRPDNVRTEKWLPQQDILAHPNIKIFITHGGLLSTIEAIYHGVPVVGIPIFGDQMMNMANAVNNGYGVLVSYDDLSEETLRAALNEVIENPKYSTNAKIRSSLMHDQQVKPIDRAVYWVEYIIKHKGAPHLRSEAVNLSWYQYLLVDVIAFLVLVPICSTSIIYILLKRILRRNNKIKQKTN